jgi:CAAX prenyl protease-like protein
MTFLLPFLIYMVVGSFEPSAPKPLTEAQKSAPESLRVQLEEGEASFLGFKYKHYPYIYTAKIALTIASMLYVLPGYREFPFRISLLAIAVGVVGVVLWIWLCSLRLEPKFFYILGLEDFARSLGERPSFNPLEALKATPAWAWTFLVIRFIGLAIIVPIIEEFFLRGFLMRYVQDGEWWKIPFGTVTSLAVVVGTAVPMLMHPGELLASFVWFSLVTWLMVRTKNIWDCVAAHAVTNFLLGLYVVTQGEWQLW